MGISGSGDLKMISCGEGAIVGGGGGVVGGIGKFASLLQTEASMYAYIYVPQKLVVPSRVVETVTAASHVCTWNCLFSLFR